MTSEALCWLTNATDPFHDTAVTPCGYPDTNTCNTIVQQYTFTTTVTSAGLPEAPTYDVHVFSLPYVTATAASILSNAEYNPNTQRTTPSLISGVPLFGGVNAVAMAAGSSLDGATTFTIQPSIRAPTNIGGQLRMIGAAFEVVNTTPELYKGGAVTCYRSPSTVTRNSFVRAVGPPTFNSPVTTIASPPYTQASAQLYPTSRTWAAEEGCYSISTMSTDENPFQMLSGQSLMMYAPPSSQQIAASSNVPCWYTGASVEAVNQKPPVVVVPFDINGAIFTGLNFNSTLQITSRYYYERIPTISEPDLLVLTRNPTPYDPVALELYTRTMTELPVAVMVKENPLGEWFNDVLGAIADIAPIVGTALGQPALGAAVGSVAKTIQPKNPPKKRKPKREAEYDDWEANKVVVPPRGNNKKARRAKARFQNNTQHVMKKKN